MGVRVRIVLYAPQEVTARTAAASAFERFAELEAVMSDYRSDSELMRLCDRAGEGPVPVSEDLFVVLESAQEVAALSGGAFDITAGPLIRLWREARKSGVMPGRKELDEARNRVGWEGLRLDKVRRTAELMKPKMRLDLGGIAKGYACDEALRALAAHGIERALVEAGGDIAASGPPPGETGWRIAVRGSPKREVLIAHEAVSTSGDTEQYVEIDGTRYSHIVDPRTGLGVTTRIQATVIAKNGLTTDPLATAFCVLGPDDAERLQKRYGAKVMFVTAKNGEHAAR